VDNRAEVRDFLLSRRAKPTPAQVGLPSEDRLRLLASWAASLPSAVDDGTPFDAKPQETERAGE
jgi:hypothetical protein